MRFAPYQARLRHGPLPEHDQPLAPLVPCTPRPLPSSLSPTFCSLPLPKREVRNCTFFPTLWAELHFYSAPHLYTATSWAVGGSVMYVATACTAGGVACG